MNTLLVKARIDVRYSARMGLLERCQELFKTSNLYEVLGIKKEATEADIRKSYYKVSLKVHPDRAPEDPLATEKFQVDTPCCEVTDRRHDTRSKHKLRLLAS